MELYFFLSRCDEILDQVHAFAVDVMKASNITIEDGELGGTQEYSRKIADDYTDPALFLQKFYEIMVPLLNSVKREDTWADLWIREKGGHRIYLYISKPE